MLYRVRVDLSFQTEQEANVVYGQIEKSFGKAVSLSTLFNEESSGFIELHKCYHDENPAKPCEVVNRVEVV